MTQDTLKPADGPQKPSVLLVDVNMHTRESRAANMRKLGASVDPVSNAAMALQHFGQGSYKLVLIDLGRDQDGAENLAREIRLKHPGQLVAFMVPGPTLIAKSFGPTEVEATIPPRVAAAAVEIPVETAPDDQTAFGRAIRNAEQENQS